MNKLDSAFIAKLLGLANYDWMTFGQSEITVKKRKAGELSINMNHIDSIQVRNGLLYGSLEVVLINKQTVILGCFPKKKLKHFYQQLINGFAIYYYENQFLIVNQALNGYPDNDHYFKKKVFDDIKSKADSFALNFKYLPMMPSDPNKIKYFDLALSLSSQGHRIRDEHNKRFMTEEKHRYQSFFQTVEKNPLTEKQVEASIINESANLIIAGAGSGKTSVMVARTGYLIQKKLATENQILLLAFNKSAALELKERITEKLDLHHVTAKTFHSLGLEVIANSTHEKPSLANWEESQLETDKLFWNIIKQIIKDEDKYKKLLTFFSYHLSTYKSSFEFETEVEYKKYIFDSNLVTLKGHRVKSFEELEIANFLFLHKIDYEYEMPYEFHTASEQYRQYQPDFYLPSYKIYLEHFGIDKQGNTASYIDSKSYNAGIEWKRAIHKQYGTQLIETYSWMRQEGHLLLSLEKILVENNVFLGDLMPYEEALQTLDQAGRSSKFANIMATFINHVRSNRHTFKQIRERAKHDERATIFIDIAEPVMNYYEALKKHKKVIDFNDMIELAIEHIKSGQYRSNYKFILVDEFQDISIARAEFVKALFNQHSDCVLTAVGDDWQSINRFAGSDISIFRDFSEFFGYSETVKLDYSFRYNDKISNVSQRFIESNPHQIKKVIKTLTKSEKKPILHFWDLKNIHEAVDNVLGNIVEEEQTASILILFRYQFKKLENFGTLKNKYPSLAIKQMTVHASKGLEADHVILLGLEGGKFGFPSNIENDPVIDMVLAHGEEYEFAEERRLFYVALTRAKKTVFILGDKTNPSVFSKELLSSPYYAEVLHISENNIHPEICPDCKNGMLLIKQGQYGLFYGCSNFKAGCSYTKPVNSCPKCFKGILQKALNSKTYKCSLCDFAPKSCAWCDGFMVIRNGRNGQFYGCNNYKKNGCRYTVNVFN